MRLQLGLKVVHVITGLGRGGAEGVLFRLAHTATGAEHVVVSLRDGGMLGPRFRVPVHTLGMRPGHLGIVAVARLARILRRERPDIVQTWMYHADLIGGLAARLSGVRAVAWGIRNSTLDRKTSSRATRAVVWLCARMSSWVPAMITCCSERARDVHVALGYDAAKFRIIPNGFDLGRYGPDEDARVRQRDAWGIHDDRRLVGVVARWDPQKGHAVFLDALARVPEVTGVLIGDGMTADNAGLMALVEAGGVADRVILVGPTDDVPAVMNALDVHVLSAVYGEAFPNVVAEAMACGTHCVVTDVGDAAMIVGDTGTVVAPGDAQALATAIAAVPAGRNDAGRRRVEEHFGLDKMAANYMNAWESLA